MTDIPGMERVGGSSGGGGGTDSIITDQTTGPDGGGLTAPAGIAYWDDRGQPIDWEIVYLAGVGWPGVAEVSGAGCSRKIDVQKTKGEDGAALKDEGYEPARLTITLKIYSAQDWQRLQELLPLIHPRKKGGARTPIDICYPSVNLLGITQIYIDKIPIPAKPSAEDGILVLELSAIEWFPEPQPVKKGAGTGKPPDTADKSAAGGKNGTNIYDATGDLDQNTNEVVKALTGKNLGEGAAGAPSKWTY
jgi:hypothetical protein